MTRSYIWQHTQLDSKAVKPRFSGRNIECAPNAVTNSEVIVKI
jgi:hypothetical protein